MIASEIGLTVSDCPGNPRLFCGFDYATGDQDPGGDVETFNHLFPLGHAYLGYVDAIGRQNIIDISPGLAFKAIDKLSVKVVGHFFWLADDSDALYNAGGRARSPRVAGTTSKEVGQEIDVVLKYALDRHTVAEFGYSHFFASNVIKDTGNGNASAVDFIYFILQYTF